MADYCPGEWYAVITEAGSALLPPTVPVAALRQVRDELHRGRGIGAVIDALAGAFGTSLSQLPPFAVLLIEADGGARVVLRGAVEARVRTAENQEPSLLSGMGVSTWSERRVDAGVWAELGLPSAASEVTLPVTDGIVLASRLRLSIDTPNLAATEPELAVDLPTVGASVAVGRESASQEWAVLDAEADAAAELTEDPPAEPEPVSEPSQPAVAPEEDARHAATMVAAAVPTEYDQLLFGETVLSSVEFAAVRAASDEADPSQPQPEAEPASAESPASPDSPDAPEPVPFEAAVPATGLISAVPLARNDGGWDDHDGETILVDQLLSQVAAAAPAGPTLARSMPSLLVPGRAPITLDRPAVIGTRPKFSRVQGGNVPILVTVESPSSEISRSHLELRREGAEVLAVDLNSTNGTVLLRLGAEPLRLQPRESYLMITGDQLDLGDGVLLGFEGLA